MTLDLFDKEAQQGWQELLCPGAVLLRHFALAEEPAILAALDDVVAAAPFRHMMTPGGLRMSVAMTNCGALGWITDRKGYRYESIDPSNGKPWPAMPDAFRRLAEEAAASAGFARFEPDACLINRYAPGARLTMHQDKDERDLNAPIVSVSLGVPAIFQFGGLQREEKALRIQLTHGDVLVWGGPARLRYHGVMPLKENTHDLLGTQRINLTFRKAG